MQAGEFMTAFKKLDEKSRFRLFDVFGRVVAEVSGHSAKDCRDEFGSAEREIFFNTAINIAGDMGWGEWKSGPHTQGEIILSVTNSPFVKEQGRSEMAVCAPILGMTRALAAIVFAVDPIVDETVCAAVTGGSQCKFTAKVG